MQIENIQIKPFTISLDPAFNITYSFTAERPFPVPIRYLGYIFSGIHRVATLQEYNFDHQNMPDLGRVNDHDGHQNKFTFSPVFTADLSQKALEKLEQNRNEKGDIILQLRFKVVYLKSEVYQFKTADTERNEHNLIATKWGTLAEHGSIKCNEEYRISGSDWIHDFVPAFSKQKYQVFEIPQPETLNAEIEVKKKLKEAIDALPQMEEARSIGEWNRVIKESRPIWELVNNKSDLENTFKGELNNDTWGSLKDLIQNFFTFSSKFIHRVSQRKELMEVNNAAKEDAELVYAMAFSIVNFISRKLENQDS